MNSIKELVIAIKTLFDGSGTEAAKKQIEQTGKSVQELQADVDKLADKTKTSGEKTESAGKKIKETGEKSQETGKKNQECGRQTDELGRAAGRAARLTNQLTDAMESSGPVAQGMGMGMRLITSLSESAGSGIMGLVTILTGAGVSAYVAYRNYVEAARQKLADFHAQIDRNRSEQDFSAVEKMAGQYDVLRRAIDDACQAQDRLNQAQTAADNADKAADLADLSLRMKEALANADADPALKSRNPDAAAKQEELNKARITSQFAKERREIEEKYALQEAEREDKAKAAALRNAEVKADITQAEIDSMKAQMGTLAGQVRMENEKLANLYGSGAPLKRQLQTSTIGTPGGIPSSRSTFIIDEAEQERQANIIRNRLNEGKYIGGRLADPTGRGLEPSYQLLAAALSEKLDKLAKEKLEIEARDIESRAASRAHETASFITPEINKADTALEKKSLQSQSEAANLAVFKDRSTTLRRQAEQDASAAKLASDIYDPSKMTFASQADRARANQTDRELAEQARKLARLSQSAKQLDDTIRALDPDALARSLDSINSRLNKLDTAVKNAEARSRRL